MVESMAAVAGLYGLGEENKRYRLKRDALEREKEKQHDALKHHDKTPDGFSNEP